MAAPQSAGDLRHQITIDELELLTASFNFEPYYADKGVCMTYIGLIQHVRSILTCGVRRPFGSTHKLKIIYEDGRGMELWKKVDAIGNVTRAVFDHLVADGQLPQGTIAD